MIVFNQIQVILNVSVAAYENVLADLATTIYIPTKHHFP